MKNYFLILIFLLTPFAQSVEIKSLLVYTETPKRLPIVEGSKKLTIEFDIAAQSEPNLIINFRFCDQDWEPYDNTFLLNQGYNTAYNLWFEQIPVPSGNVRYHFKDTFPNIDVTFPFSGKWMFYVTDSNNPDIVYAAGKFYVIKNQMPVNARLFKNRLNSGQERSVELQRTYELRVDFNLPDSLSPMDLDFVEVIENQKVEYPINLLQDRFNDLRFFETNGARGFTFIAKDIKPGNEYRQTNLMNQNKYKPPLTQAHFDGFDYDRFEQFGQIDFNGGLELINFKDNYADYMMVEFEFSPLNIISENIYLVGAFTDWEVLPQNKLDDQSGIYTVTTELKRGIYDYQYVTGYDNGEKVTDIDWYVLEGNFWETTNLYYIFVYYKSLELGGYDQIIGYIIIDSGRI